MTNLALLWTIRLCIGALMFMPLMVSTSTIFPFIVGKALYARVLIEIAFALWIILVLRTTRAPILTFPLWGKGKNPLSLTLSHQGRGENAASPPVARGEIERGASSRITNNESRITGPFWPGWSLIMAMFGLFVIASFTASFFGASFQRSIWSNWERMQGVWHLAHFWALLVILPSVIKGPAQWKALFAFMLGPSLLVAFLGIFEDNGWTWGLFPWLRGQEVSRLEISLGNATFVGAFGMIQALVALALLADSLFARREPPSESPPSGGRENSFPRRGKVRMGARPTNDESRITNYALRAFYALNIIAGLWLLSESASRGAAFGLVLGLIVAGVLYGLWGRDRTLRAWARGLTLLFLVATALFFPLRTSGVLEPFDEISPLLDRATAPFGGSAHDRALSRRQGLEGLADRPVFGYGPENYNVVWNRYREGGDLSSPTAELDQAHNKFVEVAATTGIAGLLPYIAFWLLLLFFAVKHVHPFRFPLSLTLSHKGRGNPFPLRGKVRMGASSSVIPTEAEGSEAGSTASDRGRQQAHSAASSGAQSNLDRITNNESRITTPHSQVLALFLAAAIAAFAGHLIFLFDTTVSLLHLTLLAAFAATIEPEVLRRQRLFIPGDWPISGPGATVVSDRGVILRSGSAEESQPARGRGRRRRRGRANVIPTEAEGSKAISRAMRLYAAPALVLSLLGFSLYAYNYQPWQAAQLVTQASTPEGLVENIETFDPLGTISRQQLFGALEGQLGRISEVQRPQVVAIVAEQARKALEDEPDNLKLRVAVARFFRAAAGAIPDQREALLAEARRHSDAALAIGPETFGALEDQVLQAIAEKDLEEARQAVNTWKTYNPIMSGGLRTRFDDELAALEQELS